MSNLILVLDTRVEEELSIIITIIFLLMLAVICLTIIKKIKDK